MIEAMQSRGDDAMTVALGLLADVMRQQNLRQARLFILVFGAVARGWMEERLDAAVKLVLSHRLNTRMCVCVPSEARRAEVPLTGLVDVVLTSDMAAIEEVLRKLDG